MKAMEEQAVLHSTYTIERNYPATPERVFAAFADPAKKQKWFTGGGSDVETFVMDFRVGGSEKTVRRFRPGTPFPGMTLTNDTTYQDIVTNRRVVLAYSMSLGEKRISASLATFELLQAEGGTKLVFTDQVAFFEGADGPEMRKQGWTTLLESLAAEFAS
jgi:uncharacterized protein YndB with AHSA1/START domain